MSTHESDMDFDSGVSDMTGSESVCSERSDATVIASPPSSIIEGDHGHTENDTGLLDNTVMNHQMLQDHVSGSSDSGIGSGQGSESTFDTPFPVNHSSPTMLHQLGPTAGTEQMIGPQSSRGSVLSPDSGIGSVSGRGSNVDVQLPKDRVDPIPRTQEWIESHFEVFVKTLEGKTVTIGVDMEEEVVSFRAKIHEKTSVPPSQQYLHTAEGRKLEDGKRLSAYNIKKHSTIFCQGRLRGGN